MNRPTWIFCATLLALLTGFGAFYLLGALVNLKQGYEFDPTVAPDMIEDFYSSVWTTASISFSAEGLALFLLLKNRKAALAKA